MDDTITQLINTHNKNAKHQQDLLQDARGICRCIPAGTHGSTPHLLKTVILKDNVKIIKTPTERQGLDVMKCKEFGKLVSDKFKRMHEQSRRIYDTGGVSPTIHTLGGGNTEVKVAILKQNVSEDTNKPRALGHIPYPGSDKPHQSNTFYDSKAVSPTLDTCEGGNRQVKILVEKDLPLALDEQNQYIRTDGTVGTIMTDGSSPKHNNRVIEPNKTDYRIRKLTPKECWRLMGFDDEDFEKAQKVNSNTQLYKQAGNSIVVDVLEGILGALLISG